MYKFAKHAPFLFKVGQELISKKEEEEGVHFCYVVLAILLFCFVIALPLYLFY